MEIIRHDDLDITRSPEEWLVAHLEWAARLLSEAKTLDESRKVEGFARATLEWARRQEEITLAAKNDAILLWLEARAKQGEMLREMPRRPVGVRYPKNGHLEQPPTLRELGYRTQEASVLQRLAAVSREDRERLAREHTEQARKLTERALLEATRKPQQPVPTPIPPQEREPCPDTFPEEFHNAVVVGDARVLSQRLPDESVALCFCDPVYDRIEDYEWLAKECERVLVPGGSLIVQCGNSRRFECEVAIRRSALQFVDLLAEVYPYGINRLFKAKVFVGWKPYLWFSKGPRKSGWVINRAVVGGKTYADPSKDIHPWGDGEQFAAGLIPHLCEPGDVLWDPFTGSGTVPTVAARLGIPFVAFEIDPQVAEHAQRRVQGTPREESPQQQMDFDEIQGEDNNGDN